MKKQADNNKSDASLCDEVTFTPSIC